MSKPTVNEALATEVADKLRATGRHWRIGEQLQVPSNDEVRQLLDKMVEALYASEENTQVESGGLLVKRDRQHIDIYIHSGEIR